jgi:hypothetical protein
MKKNLSAISLLLLCVFTFAQTPDSILTKSEFHSEVSKLTSKIKSLEKINSDLVRTANIQKAQIESISTELKATRSTIQQIADSLHIAVTNVSTANKQTQHQIENLNQTITNRTLYWIIGILAVALLSLITFFILRNKLTSSNRDLDSQIAKTNDAMQNEATKLDSKFVEILQTQWNLLKSKGTIQNESDHKLPLKVGEEIHRMRKRIENMPQETKGIAALKNSLQRLEDEFNESGYEIEKLEGMKYVYGMMMEARYVENLNVPKGEEIITEVLRPQIMFKGQVIQVAKVEVGKSY